MVAKVQDQTKFGDRIEQLEQQVRSLNLKVAELDDKVTMLSPPSNPTAADAGVGEQVPHV